MQDSSMFAEGGVIPVVGAELAGAPPEAHRATPGTRGVSDLVQGAFVSLAVARLERDHVALLAALCDLELEQRSVPAASVPVMRQALASLLHEELRQTQYALERAADGTLGYCQRCQSPLAISVLLSQPTTMHCAGCTAAIERGSQVH